MLKAREALADGLAGMRGVSFGPNPLLEKNVRSGATLKVQNEGYGSVGDYDPVLRAHCRLERRGSDLQ